MSPWTPAHATRRLQAWTPGSAAVQLSSQVLGQAAEKGVAAVVMLVPTAFAAAVSYVGFRTGMRDKGFPQVVGYGVGFLGGLGVLGGLLAALGIIALPAPAK